jgi:hypothetical protein
MGNSRVTLNDAQERGSSNLIFLAEWLVWKLGFTKDGFGTTISNAETWSMAKFGIGGLNPTLPTFISMGARPL